MTNDFEQPRSLGHEVTRTGGESRLDPLRPRSAGDTDASLGELQTRGDTQSSLSDLGNLEQADDGSEEIVDLESRYEILGTLGRGGMGEVVRAMDQRLKREVAIKRMRAELGANRQAMQRFLTEAVSIAALNHYNVVQIYDYGHTAEGPFLVMELVEGPTLAELLQEGPLPLETAVEVASQLSDGLQAAHDRGLIHRDIKPANILMTASGTPKLTDFGLARDVTDTGMTRTGAVLGTLDYMAPEQKDNASQVDARSDQWSLAATVYQMISGKVPRLIRLSDLPESLQMVIVRALEEDPAARYESVRQFSDALREGVNPTTGTAIERSSLQEGQCPGCGTVNEISRKFCQDCGSSLLENCPECGDPGKVWMRYCGECGTDIPEALEAQIESARELAREIQSLRASYQHSEALEKLAPLLISNLPVLAEFRQWAETTQRQLTSELAELQSQRNQLLSAARDQLSQGNISAARMYVARVPEHLQNHETSQLDEELAGAAAELKRLARDIRDATRAKRYQGLAPKVKRFLELQPTDQRARKLLQKLEDRFPQTQQLPARRPPKAGAASPARSTTESRSLISPIALGGGVVIAVVFSSLMTWIGSPEPDPVKIASVALGTATPATSRTVQPAPPAFDVANNLPQQVVEAESPPNERVPQLEPSRNTLRAPPADPVAAVIQPRPPKAAGSVKTAPRMEYLSKDGILLLFNPMGEEQSWNFLHERALIRSEDNLASPVPFDARLQISLSSHPLAEVILRGGTLAQVLPSAEKAAFGLEIRQGRIVISSHQTLPPANDAGFTAARDLSAGLALQIRIGGRDWLLKLEEPGTVCGLEVVIAQPAGYRKRPETPWFGRLVVRSGSATLQSMADDSAPVRKVEASSQLLLVDHENLDGPTNLLEPLDSVPQWLDPTLEVVQTKGSRKYASGKAILQRKLDGAEKLSLSLPQIAQDRNASASELAVLCLALTERYPNLIDVLAQSDHPESRWAAVEGIRQWLVTDPQSPERLPEALSTRFLPKVIAPLERLLWGISEADARNPDLSRQLLDMLGNENAVVRELTFQEIYRLTGVTYFFKPLTPPSQQRTSLEKWEKHLQKNGGALLPAAR